MKFLIIAVLSGLMTFIPAIAEEKVQKGKDPQQKKERNNRKDRKKRKGKRLPGAWHILRDISQEERNRLRLLYDTDPKTFRQELAKIVKRIKLEKHKLDEKVKNLVHQYKTVKDPEKKKVILKQLRGITSKIFYTKMQHNKTCFESLEKQVKKLRQQYNFRKKNADKIIQSRLGALTGNTNFEWDN